MYKLSSAEYHISNFLNAPSEGIRRNIYKKVIKPDSEKKDYKLSGRLALAGLAGGLTAASGIGLSKILKKINSKRFNGKVTIPSLVLSSLSGATLGYFHPELRNATIDYHQHKNENKLKEAIRPYINSEKNVRKRGNDLLKTDEMSKESGLVGSVLRGAGNVASTVGKTFWGGLKFGGNPSFTQKVTRFAVKGAVVGGAGYGGYKGYQAVARPQSTGNYTTFLRNNIIAGNISPNETTDREKSQINDLGMR